MSKPLCVIQGPIFNRSGYGDLATDLAKSLARYGKYEIKLAPTRWGGCPSKTSIDELDTDEDKQLASLIMSQPLQKQPDLFIQISIPNEFQPVGKYNIGITAGIETTMASGPFIEGLNRMNMNIVTSNHVKKVFEAANYAKKFDDGRQEQLKSEKPIEVCFWGADTSVYKKTDEKVESLESVLSKIPETFAYLFVGQWTHGGIYNDRKDIGNLVKTFLNAFKDRTENNRPCLILKTSGVNFSKVDRDATLSKINQIKKEVGGNLPNVYLLHGELSNKEMNALLNHEKVKFHLSFTHGEGYGHPLLLSTLSGKPVVASNWSGHLDFLNPKYSTFFEGSLKQIDPSSANEWLIKESNWFYVSYSLAEEKLKTFYYSCPKEIFEKSEKLRQENAEKFSLQAMDTKLWSILEKYVPEFAVEKKIILPKLKKIELPKLNK
jgi:glycosyltransferase involved in cell wall biosynthesis